MPWLAELARATRYRGQFDQSYYELPAECLEALDDFYTSLESSPLSAEATSAFGGALPA